MRYRFTIALLLITGVIGISLHSSLNNSYNQYFVELTLKTNGGGVRPNYGFLIAEQLEEIGIKLNVKVEIWGILVGELIGTHDYDMVIVALTGGGVSPDARSIFTEDGSLNLFQLTRDIPYQNESENMQDLGSVLMNLYERQQLYYDWQQLLMDKIIPWVPLFAPRAYTSTWSNLQGYDKKWGLINSLPYMEFVGLHEGQSSTDELNIHNDMWYDLNPLSSDDTASREIISLVDEEILPLSPGFAPVKSGLIYDWDVIDYTHLKFYMRDNVYWNPSFNVTERTAVSSPLLTETSPGVWEVTDPGILMSGLKTGEVSDGTNQQVTAYDAVFTYLAWGNFNISEDPSSAEFISDIYVDPLDPLAFHVFIDGDPDTFEVEGYADALLQLNFEILPEFFLNSTDIQVTYSSGGIPTVGLYDDIVYTPQWQTYRESAFGCGKYMLDYYIKNSITVLQKSPFWMEIGIILGATEDLDIQTININVIPDDTVALSEFKTGNLDIFEISYFPDERRNMELDSRYNILSSIRNYEVFMGFNVQRPFIGGLDNLIFLTEPGKEEYTKGVAVRKAICYAIDKVEINTQIHDGEYIIDDSPLYLISEFWYYNDIIKYNYDINLAWEWLESAGYSQSSLESGITITDPDSITETETVTEIETHTENVTEIITADPYTEIETVTVTGPPTTKTGISSPLPIVLSLAVLTVLTIGIKAIRKSKR